MAQRRWQARPDQQMETPDGPVAVISQDALVKAIYDGAILCDRAGGCLSVVLKRFPTELQGEMVTIAAIIEWKDRTDAKPAPEEAAAPVVLAAVPEPLPEPLEAGV